MQYESKSLISESLSELLKAALHEDDFDRIISNVKLEKGQRVSLYSRNTIKAVVRRERTFQSGMEDYMNTALKIAISNSGNNMAKHRNINEQLKSKK
jgi:hypothetical protein